MQNLAKKSLWETLLWKYKLVLKTPSWKIPKISGVAIEPTNACNLRCQVCFSQNPVLYKPRKKGYMDWELYKKIIDELSTFGYSINIGLNFGGESLLHNRFIDMLNYASAKKIFRIRFNTNGVFLNDDVAQALIDNNVGNITISLDGLGDVHESRRVGSHYSVVEQNIINLVQKRGNRSKPKIRVNLVKSGQSPSEIKEFVNYWINIIDCVAIYPLISEDLRIADPSFFDQAPIKENRYCTNPFEYLAVLWNGDITTCCHDINGINNLGNADKQSIANIWKSEKIKSLRHAALTNSFHPQSICHKCNVWKICFPSFSKKVGKVKIRWSGPCEQYELLAKKGHKSI